MGEKIDDRKMKEGGRVDSGEGGKGNQRDREIMSKIQIIFYRATPVHATNSKTSFLIPPSLPRRSVSHQ